MKHTFISQGQIYSKLAYITTAITETTYTNIHSLEHSTTWTHYSTNKTRPYDTNKHKLTLTKRFSYCAIIVICLCTLDVKVTWTTFNSKPTHSNTHILHCYTLTDAMPLKKLKIKKLRNKMPCGFLTGIYRVSLNIFQVYSNFSMSNNKEKKRKYQREHWKEKMRSNLLFYLTHF